MEDTILIICLVVVLIHFRRHTCFIDNSSLKKVKINVISSFVIFFGASDFTK